MWVLHACWSASNEPCVVFVSCLFQNSETWWIQTEDSQRLYTARFQVVLSAAASGWLFVVSSAYDIEFPVLLIDWFDWLNNVGLNDLMELSTFYLASKQYGLALLHKSLLTWLPRVSLCLWFYAQDLDRGKNMDNSIVGKEMENVHSCWNLNVNIHFVDFRVCLSLISLSLSLLDSACIFVTMSLSLRLCLSIPVSLFLSPHPLSLLPVSPNPSPLCLSL